MNLRKVSRRKAGEYMRSGFSDSPEPNKSGVMIRHDRASATCWCSQCHMEPPNP